VKKLTTGNPYGICTKQKTYENIAEVSCLCYERKDATRRI